MNSKDVKSQGQTGQTPDIRIIQIDVLRGFAVLGIYWINILVFALPYNSYTMPTLSGIADQANIATWAFSEIFVDGTMRGLFSILFGASAMIFLGESRLAGGGLDVVDRYYRRTLLLILFGIFHAYVLLWPYDVLYAYGLLGLFLFPLRKISPVVLIAMSCVLLVIGDIDNRFLEQDDQAEVMEANVGIRDTINALQKGSNKSQDMPHKTVDINLLNEEDIDLYRSTYAAIFFEQLKIVLDQQSTEMYASHFFDIGGMMLLGMALLRLGVLSGSRSGRYYLMLVLCGYGIGIIIRGISVYISIMNDFNAMLISKDIDISYNIGRLPITLGHVGLIGLLCQFNWFNKIKNLLSAVGRLALTNYIMQTVLSLFIFYGIGLGLYARFERYELAFLCLAVWVCQILFSLTWLHYFKLGPLEWAWRSMIYGKLQDLRKKI